MRRRLLERLQQRIERVGRQLMDLVDDVDLVAAARRRVLDVLPDGPHVVDLAIRRRVDFDDVHKRPGLGLDAHRACAARLGARPFRTQQRLGEQARGRRLADATRPGEEVGVGDAAGDERVLQRPRDRVLADDRLERLRPPLPCEHLITHQQYLTGRLRDAEPRVPITRHLRFTPASRSDTAEPRVPITRHLRFAPASRSDTAEPRVPITRHLRFAPVSRSDTKWPCTLLRSNRPAISPWRRLRPGTPTAHERVALPLLPSGPGGVRRFSLRGAQPSTPLAEAHSTRPALERGFDPARADCGQQGTATSPSSTATSKTKLAEGAGFEPAAQGLPVHGISSAAPSAARSPLRMQSLTPMPSERKIWRRGEDLNPRGTFWAPIRFRVGRLQPGSATPPHTYMTRDTSSCLTVKSRASCIAAAPSGAATKAAAGAWLTRRSTAARRRSGARWAYRSTLASEPAECAALLEAFLVTRCFVKEGRRPEINETARRVTRVRRSWRAFLAQCEPLSLVSGVGRVAGTPILLSPFKLRHYRICNRVEHSRISRSHV